MTSTKRASGAPSVLLSSMLKHAVLDAKGESVGEVADLIVALRGEDYPQLTGLVAKIGSINVFVPIGKVISMEADRVELRSAKLDLRPFERRTGEVLLRADVLGHRLIDVDRAILVRAYDVQLTRTDHGWIVTGLDVHKRRLIHFGARHERHPIRDWRSFEALIGHAPSVLVRSPFGKLRRLKPAQLADLIEDASGVEQDELLAHVHTDPELEADVFEELDDDQQMQLLRSRPVEQIAEVIARMHADDAADALMDLPQDKRLPVLELLPQPQRGKVRTLLGYNTLTAGGLMGVDYLTAADTDTVEHVVELVRTSTSKQPEALTTIFSLDEQDRLSGVVSLVQVLQAPADSRLEQITDRSPIHVHPDDDLVDVARQMADFNLLVLPVIDEKDRRMLGVITVDDAFEATIPQDWMRREPHRHAAISTTTEGTATPDPGQPTQPPTLSQ